VSREAVSHTVKNEAPVKVHRYVSFFYDSATNAGLVYAV
jgi:hypothetical protein